MIGIFLEYFYQHRTVMRQRLVALPMSLCLGARKVPSLSRRCADTRKPRPSPRRSFLNGCRLCIIVQLSRFGLQKQAVVFLCSLNVWWSTTVRFCVRAGLATTRFFGASVGSCPRQPSPQFFLISLERGFFAGDVIACQFQPPALCMHKTLPFNDVCVLDQRPTQRPR